MGGVGVKTVVVEHCGRSVVVLALQALDTLCNG